MIPPNSQHSTSGRPQRFTGKELIEYYACVLWYSAEKPLSYDQALFLLGDLVGRPNPEFPLFVNEFIMGLSNPMVDEVRRVATERRAILLRRMDAVWHNPRPLNMGLEWNSYMSSNEWYSHMSSNLEPIHEDVWAIVYTLYEWVIHPATGRFFHFSEIRSMIFLRLNVVPQREYYDWLLFRNTTVGHAWLSHRFATFANRRKDHWILESLCLYYDYQNRSKSLSRPRQPTYSHADDQTVTPSFEAFSVTSTAGHGAQALACHPAPAQIQVPPGGRPGYDPTNAYELHGPKCTQGYPNLHEMEPQYGAPGRLGPPHSQAQYAAWLTPHSQALSAAWLTPHSQALYAAWLRGEPLISGPNTDSPFPSDSRRSTLPDLAERIRDEEKEKARRKKPDAGHGTKPGDHHREKAAKKGAKGSHRRRE